MLLDFKDILQPELTELNRLPARASFSSFASTDAALTDEAQPSWRLSLDGKWQFQLIDSPSDAPSDWAESAFKDDEWRSIVVPGSWTRQNSGDRPQYTNVQMPFACREAPQVPEENPTGLYRTTFTCPPGWEDRETILHLGGFESVALVWCNGKFVGMGKDSRLPSEFNLTPYLTGNVNNLAVMVIKWSDATWIEDQDHWYHGGLHRSVYVESRGRTHIADMQIVADFDASNGTGHLQQCVMVNGASKGWTARAQLLAPDGQVAADLADMPIAQFPDGSVFDQFTAAYSFVDNRSVLATNIADCQPWSSEDPVLYQLVTELVDDQGKIVEVTKNRVGFRRIEIKNRQLLINDKPIVIIGVNRHDHHPETGKTSTIEEMREELLLMRRYNINAIRTAHYPNDHRLLDLCDELGLYVIDEANVECHARWQAVSNDPRYQKAIIERVMRMVFRDRNHSSVIGWSLGNEAGLGPAHDAAAALVRRIDDSRILHYEGAIFHRFQTLMGDPTETSRRAPDMRERMTTDLICPMYPSIDFIVGWARWAEESQLDDRPMILCEFSHAMGNSNGSLVDYVDAFFAEPALGGGFVWEWRDHGFAETDDQGRFYWAYGGHFDDSPNDVNFCCDGMVGPDLLPHPGLREYQWAARPIKGEWLGKRQVRFENRRAFKPSNDLELQWMLQKNGEDVENGTLFPHIAAGDSVVLTIDFQSEIDEASEWHLLTRWVLKKALPWADAGYAVGWDQFPLNVPAASVPVPAERQCGQQVTDEVSIGPFAVTFDEAGQIQSLDVHGSRIVEGDITATLWRAPMDNDGGKIGWREERPSKRMEWVNHGLDRLTVDSNPAQVSVENDQVSLYFERHLIGTNQEQAVHKSWWILNAEKAEVHEEISIPEAWTDLPRIGICFVAPSQWEQLSWFGLGPDESYPDRTGAQIVRQWSSTVTDQYHPYVLPQEHGAHEQTRFFRLQNESGQGFEIHMPGLSFSARHHHDADISKATTIADVKRRNEIEVHIDAAMRGVGTGACGPDALPAYRVGPGRYKFHWMIKPV
ncbi:MAG: glycoside hydrolase family 2 TIM barrel-domain containing protein [Parasphingorhabdus sp.]|uniref:glycoside hydrolase family 2 TIM barrel-domain containing protein n=1 Tax=Parasphingorhabdus sp. TaxID=2709688 RepID=UPI00329792AD